MAGEPINLELPADFRLTKTTFLQGRQCPLRLWYRSRRIPEEKVESSAEDFADASGEVERIAELRFPGGVTVERPDGEARLSEAHAERTTSLMADPAIPAVFQGVLLDQSLAAIPDILMRAEDGWIVYEVKASTSRKRLLDWDLGFQWRLLAACGYTVVGARLLILNKDFVRPDGDLDTNDLLTEIDCTTEVRALVPEIDEEIQLQLTMLQAPQPPDEQPGPRCKKYRDDKDGRRPSTCGHLDRNGSCGRALPEHWSLTLPNLRQGAKYRHIVDNQIDSIEDLDPNDEAVDWTDVQRRVIEAVQAGQPQVDADTLRLELDGLEWPVAYMDFEFDSTLAILPFSGMRPYQRLPFQWSLHIQDSPDSDLVSPDPFLHRDNTDPRRPFIESLLQALPPSGSIAVHYRNAESTVIGQYENWFDGRYWQRVQPLLDRLFDTCALARNAYYHPDMDCSFSIKNLAPALLGTGYEDLAIQDGMEAVRQWKQLVAQDTSEDERHLIARDLLLYCAMDTRLMYGIIEAFRRLAWEDD